MSMRHDDHDKKSYFRSPDRVFQINGAWYFATREGDQGPFASEAQAQMEIERLITKKTELARFQKARELARQRKRSRVKNDERDQGILLLSSRDMPTMRPAVRKPVKRKVSI